MQQGQEQPTVDLPAPISQSVPVSCSGISGAGLVTVGSDGTISTAFSIISPTSGPPCGGSDLVACPAKDSAGNAPLPTQPVTPARPPRAVSAGDLCVLAFGDSSSSDPQVKVLISFVPAPTASPVSQSTGASVTQGGSAGAASTSPATGSSTPARPTVAPWPSRVPVLACGPSSWAASS